MRALLAPACGALLLCGTASAQPGPAADCRALVEVNAEIPGREPDSIVRASPANCRGCGSERLMRGKAMTIACAEGYALASLINVQPATPFTNWTYLADIALYRSSEGFRIAGRPVRKIRDNPAAGIQILFKPSFGRSVAGPQSRPGLVNDSGDVADADKIGFYLSLRWFFLPDLGVLVESGGLWANAVAPKTKPMLFTREWSTNLGLSLIAWQRSLLPGRVQAVANGGLNWSRLVLADEYADFIEKDVGILLSRDAATGLGWYVSAQGRAIMPFGLVFELGPRYAYDNVTFEGAKRSFGGYRLAVDAGVGWRF